MKLAGESLDRVLEQLRNVDLGDERRSARLLSVVEALARTPTVPFPEAMASDAMLEGAYRLMNNPAVHFDDIHDELAHCTAKRAQDAQSVLVVHDTTTFEFSHADPEEVGFLSTGKAGFLFHASLVLDANGIRRPLGVLAAEVISRAKRSSRGSRKHGATSRQMARWQDKESDRWLRGVLECAGHLETCRDVVHVMDSEGDSFGLLSAMKKHDQRFVVRSCHERSARKAGDVDWGSLYATLRDHQGEFEREVHLSRRVSTLAKGMKRSGRPMRNARQAKLRFAAATVEVKRSRSAPDDSQAVLPLALVRVWEVDVPQGETPIEWWLLTTEPVDSHDDIARVVDIYRQRWLIEELFKALKTGCIYEERQFESKHALLNLLASTLPIAVEMLHLRTRAVSEPNAPATDVLNETQIEVLRRMSARKLSNAPTIHDVLLAIAGLGGHWRSNGPPGWLILKRGMVKLLAFEAGWRAAINAKNVID